MYVHIYVQPYIHTYIHTYSRVKERKREISPQIRYSTHLEFRSHPLNIIPVAGQGISPPDSSAATSAKPAPAPVAKVRAARKASPVANVCYNSGFRLQSSNMSERFSIIL